MSPPVCLNVAIAEAGSNAGLGIDLGGATVVGVSVSLVGVSAEGNVAHPGMSLGSTVLSRLRPASRSFPAPGFFSTLAFMRSYVAVGWMSTQAHTHSPLPPPPSAAVCATGPGESADGAGIMLQVGAVTALDLLNVTLVDIRAVCNVGGTGHGHQAVKVCCAFPQARQSYGGLCDAHALAC
jgi:hypothetical protein